MSKFTKKQSRRQGTGINTSSLPDIVFMLLFFFVAIGMVPAPLPDIDYTPVVQEGGTDLEETKHYIQIHLGTQDGELVAQIGYNTVVGLDKITEEIKEIRKEDPSKFIVVLRIDGEFGMGYLRNEVEPAILDAGIKSVAYVLEDEKEV